MEGRILIILIGDECDLPRRSYTFSKQIFFARFDAVDYIYPRFDAVEAYRRAMKTWAKWIKNNIERNKLVFYRLLISGIVFPNQIGVEILLKYSKKVCCWGCTLQWFPQFCVV